MSRWFVPGDKPMVFDHPRAMGCPLCAAPVTGSVVHENADAPTFTVLCPNGHVYAATRLEAENA